MYDETYRGLSAHLDRLPGGFGSDDEAAEQRLLQLLFTPEEAELAIHLTLERDTAGVIASRAGLPVHEAAERLAEMAHKGLIVSVQRGEPLYEAVPFVGGIWGFQVNRLDAELLRVVSDYRRAPRPRPSVGPRRMRTIPIGASLDARLEVLPHEKVGALVAAQKRFAVAPCICRRSANLAGKGCDAPEESCLIFGDWADYRVQSGRAKAVDRDEVMAILARADAANLVLQPSNSKDVRAICCCCGCCCGILGDLKRQAKPAEAVANAFIARFDPELCTDCGTCLERCQMDAFTQGEAGVSHNADRCIGCGLCVSACPSGALTLARKPHSEHLEPPETMSDTWRQIVQAQEEAR
jgi:Na+-translocating ferredoxin:NAD+ oxidoreductase subunit B